MFFADRYSTNMPFSIYFLFPVLEVMQLFPIVETLGINEPCSEELFWALGSIGDIVCYAVGIRVLIFI